MAPAAVGSLGAAARAEAQECSAGWIKAAQSDCLLPPKAPLDSRIHPMAATIVSALRHLREKTRDTASGTPNDTVEW